MTITTVLIISSILTTNFRSPTMRTRKYPLGQKINKIKEAGIWVNMIYLRPDITPLSKEEREEIGSIAQKLKWPIDRIKAVTIAKLSTNHDQPDQKNYMGFSACSIYDNFDKKTGGNRALERALDNLGKDRPDLKRSIHEQFASIFDNVT